MAVAANHILNLVRDQLKAHDLGGRGGGGDFSLPNEMSASAVAAEIGAAAAQVPNVPAAGFATAVQKTFQ